MRIKYSNITFLLYQSDTFDAQHVVCRLYYAENWFYEWKMTENGKILDTSLFTSYRDRMLSAMPSYRDSGLKYSVIQSHSTRGIVGWAIRRYATEQYVMAKLAGFDIYDISDDFTS